MTRPLQTKRSFLVVLGLMAMAIGVEGVQAQQTGAIRGRLIDNTSQQPLAVAQVRIAALGIGVLSGSDGTYNLPNVPAGTHTVIAELIGFSSVSQEVTVAAGETAVVDFALNTQALALDELVVVAYGTQTRASIAGAVGTVNSEDLNRTAAVKATEALVGKVPGVLSRTASDDLGDARPGAGTAIQIRNLGNPLIVIDGVPQSYRNEDGRWEQRNGEEFSSPLDDLNPADIESISVLKDASASIYGFRASNGVILVTTKKGQSNSAPRIQVSGTHGWQNVTATPFSAMANAYQYQLAFVETEQNQGQPRSMPADELAKWRAGTEPGYASYNHYDGTGTPNYGGVFNNQNAAMYNLNTSVSGGVGDATYYVSMGRASQDWLLQGHTFNRNNLQANIRAPVSDNFVIGAQLSGTIENRDNVALPEREDPVYTAMLGINSSWPIDQPYANNNPNYVNGNTVRKRLSRLPSTFFEDIAGWIRDDRRGANANFYAEYTAPFGTQLRAAYSQGFRNNVWERHRFVYDAYCYDPGTDAYYVGDPGNVPSCSGALAGGGGNERRKEREEYQSQYAELRLNHAEQIGNHSLNGTFGFEASGNEVDILALTAIPSSNFNKLVELTQINDFDNQWDKTARQSFLGRFAYNYAEKYFLETTGRYEGSYLYTEDNRWGFFPGVSLAWRPTQESFMQGRMGWLDDLKIRASWGEAGQELGVNAWDYLSGATYGVGGGYIFDGTQITGVRPRGLAVTELSWVTSVSRNIGVDAVMLGNRLSLEFDVFERKRTGLPAGRTDVLLPLEVGYDLPNENLESDARQGFEGRITYTDQAGAIAYSASLNGTVARSKTLSTYKPRFGNSWDEYRNGEEGRWDDLDFVGHKLGQFETMEQIESYPVNLDGQGNRTLLPGDWIFEDVNGDGIWNGMDSRPTSWNDETTSPLFMFGGNFSAGYQGFSLGLDFSGAAGYSWEQAVEMQRPFTGGHNSQTFFFDNWHRADPYNDQSEWIPGFYPPMRRGGNHYAFNEGDTDAWKRNMWYLRLKRIELGYTLPGRITESLNMASGRVIISYDNPLTWSAVDNLNMDPEVNQESALRYPTSKIFTVGFSAVLGG